MKTKKTSLLFPLLCAALLAVGASMATQGCAGTRTRESTGEYIDNSAITARVKAVLADDEIVKARDIKVESFRGTVQLSGFVNTSEEKTRAGRLAATVEGVREVENNLIVK